MSDDIPDHYRALLKDWHRIELPPHVNPHSVALKCDIPLGSYFVAGGTMLVETQAYLDSVSPLMAAEAIASPEPESMPAEEDEAVDAAPAYIDDDGDESD